MSQVKTELEKTKEVNDQQVKALIFDFGGVIDISSNAIEAWTKAFNDLGIKDEISMDREPCKSLISDYQIGKFASDQDFLKKLREILIIPVSMSDKTIIDAWNAQIQGQSEELHKLVDYSKKFKLLALSNTNKMHRDFAEHVKYPEYLKKHADKNLPKKFRDLFSKVYCSHEIHTRKPHPEAWITILRDHPELSANQFIFIDDVKEYIDAAVALGLHAFHFDMTKHSFDDVIKYVEELNNVAVSKIKETVIINM
jgi:FMN phosphatase YigB (HAD superfamily)